MKLSRSVKHGVYTREAIAMRRQFGELFRLKPGVVNEMMHVNDVYPTLVAVAQNKPLDGVDVWSTFLSQLSAFDLQTTHSACAAKKLDNPDAWTHVVW